MHGGRPWQSFDPDTSRIWWEDVGVHQNLTHAVHPDPVSGGHCWLQKAISVRKASPGRPARRRLGGYGAGRWRSTGEWKAMTRPAARYSPDGTRRPLWLKRPLKPAAEAYGCRGEGRTGNCRESKPRRRNLPWIPDILTPDSRSISVLRHVVDDVGGGEDGHRAQAPGFRFDGNHAVNVTVD